MNGESVIVDTWGHLPKFKSKGPSEYSSACPVCGGKDRFFMRWDGAVGPRGYCRECKKSYWPDDKNRHKLTEDERLAIARESARKKKKGKQLATNLNNSKDWQQYVGMTNSQRKAWRDEGISDAMQEQYELGYIQDKEFWHDSKPILRDALTIPMWHYENKVTNMQFRIINGPEDMGKYRSIKGFPMQLFYAIPGMDITNRIVLCEGAKKAMVMQQAINEMKYDAAVVAVHSKMPGLSLVRELNNAQEVIIALDPDAYVSESGQQTAVSRIIQELRIPTRVARFPVKPDDLIVRYNRTPKDLIEILALSRFVK